MRRCSCEIPRAGTVDDERLTPWLVSKAQMHPAVKLQNALIELHPRVVQRLDDLPRGAEAWADEVNRLPGHVLRVFGPADGLVEGWGAVAAGHQNGSTQEHPDALKTQSGALQVLDDFGWRVVVDAKPCRRLADGQFGKREMWTQLHDFSSECLTRARQISKAAARIEAAPAAHGWYAPTAASMDSTPPAMMAATLKTCKRLGLWWAMHETANGSHATIMASPLMS